MSREVCIGTAGAQAVRPQEIGMVLQAVSVFLAYEGKFIYLDFLSVAARPERRPYNINILYVLRVEIWTSR